MMDIYNLSIQEKIAIIENDLQVISMTREQAEAWIKALNILITARDNDAPLPQYNVIEGGYWDYRALRRAGIILD